jgi:hypothetical protein
MLRTDPAQALNDLEALASRDSLMSMVYLGWAYSKGDGLDQDARKAEEWYRKAADAGSVMAGFYLGVLLLNQGRFEQAIREFELGVKSEFTPSIDRLGKMYFYGLGVPSDILKAKELWQRAANRGHVRAMRRLAFAMAGGRYGVLNIPRGVVMIITLIADIYRIASQDPRSDLLM